ncbi:SGNH/GDSL hydrolase family protein [Euzebya sp.]|uniref:SGNH/GDSL hydrolase family protein n=1 Tax=Euzebya sp. TaxID=1971409 RepID=UPI0035181696
MVVVLALIAALVLGGLAALAITPAVGVGIAGLILLTGIAAQRAGGTPRRLIGTVLLLALLAGGSWGGVVALDVLEAVSGASGPADPADPAALAAAQAKLDGLGEGRFRIELTEPELEAVIQDGIAQDPDLPIRRVDLDLRGATADAAFTATFKSGSVQATGTAAVRAVDGGVDLDLGPLDFGPIAVPAVAGGAVESLLGAVTDLNAALESRGATVDAIEVTDDLLVITGTRGGQLPDAPALTGNELLDAIRDQAAVAVDQVQAPPEVVGPGEVNGREAPGEPIVLALGDSLAEGVGVAEPRDGYVSRFHTAIGQADGVSYGLVNLGVSGETSASLLTSGQLARAEAALAERPAAYVTLDVGANDLLGHLQSPDCGADLRSPACQQRVEQTLASYRANLDVVLPRLRSAAGDATVVLLTTYNPFSLGLGESEQEVRSSEYVSQLNAVAADVAAAHGVVVADGFSPLQGTTAATTHMLDAQPDIHPNAAGHDVLANALLTALGHGR